MQAHAECFGTEIVYNHINEVDLNIRSEGRWMNSPVMH